MVYIPVGLREAPEDHRNVLNSGLDANFLQVFKKVAFICSVPTFTP